MQCPNWLQKMPVRSFYILWATIVHFRFVNNLIILMLFGGYFVLVGMIAIEGCGYQFFLAYFTMVTFIMFSFLDKSKKSSALVHLLGGFRGDFSGLLFQIFILEGNKCLALWVNVIRRFLFEVFDGLSCKWSGKNFQSEILKSYSKYLNGFCMFILKSRLLIWVVFTNLHWLNDALLFFPGNNDFHWSKFFVRNQIK